MKKDKNCRWHFGAQDGLGNDIGPNDPIVQNFKGNPYYSIVRESIQNSLDAVNNTNKPVIVSFDHFTLYKKDYPKFFDIENHIKLGLEYYKNNANAQRLFGNMTKYLSDNKGSLTCLRISDYNTKGMDYKVDSTDCRFYGFLLSGGVSNKDKNSGGSFGFGKGAYFALSELKTIIVSSKDKKGNVIFQGSTRLTTHKDKKGNRLSGIGHYGSSKDSPTTEKIEIPSSFIRKETGTDISIIGIKDMADKKETLIKSVLNNFWLAIHEGKLIVEINKKTIINKDTLEGLMDQYFHNDSEQSLNDIERWNPKPYYKAVKNQGSDQNTFKVFEENLKTLGKVTLYMYVDKNAGLPNRISFFRKPKMVVFKNTFSQIKGFAGVLVCDNKKGDAILREMENPAHNEWKWENCTGEDKKIGKEAKNELRTFINDCLDSLTRLQAGDEISIMGLDEFISIPEDFLSDNEQVDYSMKGFDSSQKQMTMAFDEEENGSQTTGLRKSIKIKPTMVSKIIKNTPKPVPAFSLIPTNTIQSQSKNAIDVTLRVIAKEENNEMYHNLILHVDRDISNSELELVTGCDNGDEVTNIVFSNDGSFSENKLIGLALKSGINKIKVKFEDNIKHSIKVKAYEL